MMTRETDIPLRQVRTAGSHGASADRCAESVRPQSGAANITNKANPGGREACYWGLRIADWGFAAGVAPNEPNFGVPGPGMRVTAKNKANSPAGRPAIGDCGFEIGDSRRRGRGMANEANFGMLRGAMENKANSPGGRPAIGDCGLEIGDSRRRGRGMANEANFGMLGPRMRDAMENEANSVGRDCRVASLLAMTPAGKDAVMANEANLPPAGRRRRNAKDADVDVNGNGERS